MYLLDASACVPFVASKIWPALAESATSQRLLHGKSCCAGDPVSAGTQHAKLFAEFNKFISATITVLLGLLEHIDAVSASCLLSPVKFKQTNRHA